MPIAAVNTIKAAHGSVLWKFCGFRFGSK